MTAMDCARFEAVLAEILADPRGGAADPRFPLLRAHAAACPACGACTDLLDLAVLPAERRDPIPDPGGAYWSAFDARLRRRLPGRGPRRVPGWVVLAGAAAATIAAAAILSVALDRDAPRRPAVAQGPRPATPSRSETPPVPPRVDDAAETSDDLAQAFAGSEPMDAFAENDQGAIFPSADDLTPAAAERFIEWMKQEESRAKGGAA